MRITRKVRSGRGGVTRQVVAVVVVMAGEHASFVSLLSLLVACEVTSQMSVLVSVRLSKKAAYKFTGRWRLSRLPLLHRGSTVAT